MIYWYLFLILVFTNCKTVISAITGKNFCSFPETPKNGQVTVLGRNDGSYKSGDEVPISTVINFNCKAHYALMPDSAHAVCVEGRWIPDIPKCERTCKGIKSSNVLTAECYKNDRVVSCDKPISGTMAKVTCAPFYEDPSSIHSPYRYCLDDGVWDYSLPNCVSVCGQKFVNATPTIINRLIVKRDHWSWVVGVYHKNTEKYICGGSILNDKVILSAAHCFINENGVLSSPDLYVIGAGKNYHNVNNNDNKHEQHIDVQQIHIPDEYVGEAQNYFADIAVVVVKEPFKFTDYVHPVCVDWSGRSENGQLKTVTKGTTFSWGLIPGIESDSLEMRQLEVSPIDIADCKERLPSLYKKFAIEDKLCGAYENQSKLILCHGDSGNGYVFEKNGRYFIRGVVSISSKSLPSLNTCDSNQHTLFTKISNYQEFIYKHVSQLRSSS